MTQSPRSVKTSPSVPSVKKEPSPVVKKSPHTPVLTPNLSRKRSLSGGDRTESLRAKIPSVVKEEGAAREPRGMELPSVQSLLKAQDIPYEKVQWGEDTRAIQALDKGFIM